MAGHAEIDRARPFDGAPRLVSAPRGVRDSRAPRDLEGRLSALILCGGKSRRMGSDKALIAVHGETLLERAVETVRPWTSEVRLACGEHPRYESLGLRLVLDGRPDAGPLAGIEAGLSDVPEGWCLILACDMPRVSGELFGLMLDRAVAEDVDVCWLESDAGTEPLCGVYHTRVVAAVRAALDAGERKVTSFLRYELAAGLERRRPRVAAHGMGEGPAADPPASREMAMNVNTPADVRALERAAAHDFETDRTAERIGS